MTILVQSSQEALKLRHGGPKRRVLMMPKEPFGEEKEEDRQAG